MVRLLREKFIKREREGSSLVSVVIGVAFLAAIGIIVLTAANQYFISVGVDHNASNNFYEAEAILEEVKTGLLEYAGDAAEEAYRDVLQNYSKDKDSKREAFSKKYFSLLATKLQSDSAGTYDWDPDKVGKAQPAEIGKLQVLSNYPDAVSVAEGTELSFVIQHNDTTGEYKFVIQNLFINYEDDIDYRSSIQTDICLSVPDYSLEGNSTFDEMKDYISISDDTLQVADYRTGNTIQGNVYSGNKEQGIVLGLGSGVNFKSPMIISRGDLEIHNGATATLAGETGAGELYLKNIHLTPGGSEGSTLQTNLTLNENAYIANDLNIEANNAVVTLGGKYYGYSYNENNDNASSTASSDFSSAILINGLNTTLQSNNLNSLILAGRAFVSRQKADNVKTVSDIMMGESIAVKSNQLAYLVPDEYIVSTNGSSGDYHNPVFKSEVEAGSVHVDVEGLKSKFGEYLNESKPYEENYNNTIGYVFYYLKFKSDAKANEYFEAYYNGNSLDEDGNTIINKDELQSKGKVYISNKDLDIKFDQTLYLVAGNVMNNYYNANGSSLQQATYFGNNQLPSNDLLAEGRRIGEDYVGRQLGLTPAKNTTGDMRLPEDAGTLVASNIVDFDSEKFNKEVTSNEEYYNEGDTGVKGAVLCISKGDYTVSTKMTGLLIVNGDVTVNSDFTGLVLATGKVKVENQNLVLKSDMVTVGKLFDYIRTDEALCSLFPGLSGVLKEKPENLEDCISYQNWVKNSY